MTKCPQLWKRVLALSEAIDIVRGAISDVIDEVAKLDGPEQPQEPPKRKRFYVVED